MGKLVFNRTHRMLLKSTKEDFKYHTVEIDVSSGLLRKMTVDSKDTKIRVNSEIYGEVFGINGSTALSVEQIESIESEFNSVRESKGWEAAEFRKSKEVKNEVSNPSEVQGQEEAKTI